MREYQRFSVLATVLATAVLMGAGCGQAKPAEETTAPAAPPQVSDTVSAENQEVKDGKLLVAMATVGSPSFVVIHADANGQPGEVIGNAPLTVGANTNVVVTVDAKKVTPKVYAMLHVDKGVAGTYEFPGADVPTVDAAGNVVMAPLTITNAAAMMKKDDSAVKKDDAAMKKDGTAVKVEVKADATVKTETGAMETKIITVTAKKFQFDPATITVKKGAKVTLNIKSVDVSHGFSLPDFNVNATLEPNKTATVTFTADKTGTFSFSCSIFCGSGHGDMKGTLIVQ